MFSVEKIGFIDFYGIYFFDKWNRRIGRCWRFDEDCVEMEKIFD